MSKYRILVSIDEKNFFWIVVDNGKLIKNPTKDDLKGTKLKSYNSTNICPACKKDYDIEGKELTDKSILYPKNACHETDKNGEKTDEWVCIRHGLAHYNRYSPNGIHKMKKSLRDRRIGNLKYDRHIFGDDCELLTEKCLGAKRLNIQHDDFELPLDHAPISKHISIIIDGKLVDLYGKILQTKGSRLNVKKYLSVNKNITEYEIWSTYVGNEHTKEFDFLIFYCASKDGDMIERIYIFPKFEILNITRIGIHKNAVYGWYEKYRIIDGDIIRLINKIWQDIRKEKKRQNEIPKSKR